MMRRRDFLWAAAASPLAATRGVKRGVFLPSPGKGTAVMAFAYYTKPTGGEMISVEQRLSRSDTIDISYYRNSTDNGRTWSRPKAVATGEKRPGGMWRKHPRAGYVDRGTGRLLEFWLEGVLPSDDPLEGMKQWNVYYRVDNGEKRQVIAEGKEFGPRHPLPAVYTGRNSMMLGDLACKPVTRKDGTILLPLEITPLGPGGEYYNPGGGLTYTDAVLALGRWKGGRLAWQASEHIVADPRKSTRGMVEPTVEILDDGRVLVVMRGSNDKKPELPSYRWAAYSRDGGRTFTKPAPWTYDTGEAFYSPSSCSQLLKHSSGRLFWLGNITPGNARGNRPRYPLVIGEVDRRTGLLGKKSVREVDGRRPGESEILTLSNFFAHEDRETAEIVLYMTRLFAFPEGWEGDGMIYRIEV